MGLADADLRSRVRTHTRLTAALSNVAEKGGGAAPSLADVVRRHTDAVIGSLDAHVNEQSLPLYQPPPLDRAAELLAWKPQP
jgi:hypothetical protein